MLEKLLHHKKQEPPPEPEQPTINLKDLAKLETATEEQILSAIQKEPRLSERKESLARYLQKMEIKPLEVVEEKILRKQKLNRILVLMTQEIHNREQRQIQAQFEQQKDWNKENIPKLLPNIRFATKDVRLLREGMLNISVISWNTPESTKIKIGNVQFDLLKIHPSKWQELMTHKFTPMFFQVRGNAIRDGKEMGKWRNGSESYERNKQIQIVSPLWICFMVV